MTRTQAATGFAVEVFVEQNQVPPVRITRVFLALAMAGPSSFVIRQKDASEPAREFVGHFLERQHVSGADGTFNFERFAIEKMITLKRFDDEEVDREPNRAAPVRVATEKITGAFAWNVIDAVFFVASAEDIRFFVMDA